MLNCPSLTTDYLVSYFLHGVTIIKAMPKEQNQHSLDWSKSVMHKARLGKARLMPTLDFLVFFYTLGERRGLVIPLKKNLTKTGAVLKN